MSSMNIQAMISKVLSAQRASIFFLETFWLESVAKKPRMYTGVEIMMNITSIMFEKGAVSAFHSCNLFVTVSLQFYSFYLFFFLPFLCDITLFVS